MRFLIFRENGFATFMSFLGFFCGGIAIVIGQDISWDETMIIPTIVATALCIFFYAIAYRSSKKTVRERAEAEAQYRTDHPEFFDK